MSGDQERDAPWQHPDDKFRLHECKYCDALAADIQTLLNTNMILAQGGEELHAEVTHLRQVCRNVYEVWAGSEGIPMPETCTEAYLMQLIDQMIVEAKEGL